MDGGYYDNYGVASALDWLAPVIEDRFECDTGLSFRRVLVIQLRSSNPKKRDRDPVSGKGRLVRTGHRHIEFPRPVGSYAQRHRAAPTLEILGAAICRQDGKTSGAISHAGVRLQDPTHSAVPVPFYIGNSHVSGGIETAHNRRVCGAGIRPSPNRLRRFAS